MSEIRDRVGEQIVRILKKPMVGPDEPSAWHLADEILAIPELAVVDREAETSFLPAEVQVKLGIDDLMQGELDVAFRHGYDQKHIDMLKAGWLKEVKGE